MSKAKVPFLRPQLPAIEDVAAYFNLAEQARYYSNGGPCEQLLRRRLSNYLNGARCLPVTNATAGIMTALRAVTELRATADRPLVVTPSYTFAATAGAVVVLGFRPLFLDVDPNGWQLDGDALEQVLRERGDEIAAVLATTTFGVPPSADTLARWTDLCERRGVPLVVDAAAGFGGHDDEGTRTGCRDAVHVFSFHATKPFGIGEGGMISTWDDAVLEYCEAFRQFGFANSKLAVLPGINSKMDELHAAVALTVLDRYAGILQTRRSIAARYQDELEPLGFVFQAGAQGGTWQAGYLQAPRPELRDAIVAAGAAAEIEIKTYYDVPLHRHPAYADAPRHGDLPITEHLAAGALSLPMANDLASEQVDRVIDAVSSVLVTPTRQPIQVS